MEPTRLLLSNDDQFPLTVTARVMHVHTFDSWNLLECLMVLSAFVGSCYVAWELGEVAGSLIEAAFSGKGTKK
jgi:hypothetical protein